MDKAERLEQTLKDATAQVQELWNTVKRFEVTLPIRHDGTRNPQLMDNLRQKSGKTTFTASLKPIREWMDETVKEIQSLEVQEEKENVKMVGMAAWK